MAIKVLLFAILIGSSLPWRSEGLLRAWTVRVRYITTSCPCLSATACITGSGKIYFCDVPEALSVRTVVHEYQHALLVRYEIANWPGFKRACQKLLASGQLTEHQVSSIIAMSGPHKCGGGEVHAELPWLLQGNIPPYFQPWYPWFDLSTSPPLNHRP